MSAKTILQYWQLPRGEWFVFLDEEGKLKGRTPAFLKIDDATYAEFDKKTGAATPCWFETAGLLMEQEVARCLPPRRYWWELRGTSLKASLEGAMFYDEVSNFELHDDPYGVDLKKRLIGVVVTEKPQAKKPSKAPEPKAKPKWAEWPSPQPIKVLAKQALEADAAIFDEIAKAAEPQPEEAKVESKPDEDDRWGGLMI
jgi:hypothetical protein